MPDFATRKDVLYALQFGGEKLVYEGGARSRWFLERSGVPVAKTIAHRVVNLSHVTDVPMLPGAALRAFMWKVPL
ncbi:MAG TPA: hypothetical protein VGM83_18840 [Devosiaceae bacterium]|jgi:hypothetical protein